MDNQEINQQNTGQNPEAPKQPSREAKTPSAESAKKKPAAPSKAQAKAAKAAPAKKKAAAPAKKPAGKKAAPKRRTADSGYVPYQQAKQKRKAQQGGPLSLFRKKKLTSRPGTMADNPQFTEKKTKKQTPPAVVYTEAKAFSRSRFLVQILSVFAVVVALVLCLSVFFRIKTITVSGAEAYSSFTIREASGISEGDNLLTFGRARAAGQILANLPYVRNVRIGIKLPDTVKIEVEEEDVVYAIQDVDKGWWLMNSDGKILSQTNLVGANKYTKVLGVELEVPTAGQQAVARETFIPVETTDDTQQADTTNLLTGAAKLETALEILRELEKNDVMGDVASVDVTRLDDMILWYGTQYQVNLGDEGMLEYKIACMVDAILQMSEYQNGVLDVSFITWPDQVGFTPFG